MTSKNADSSSSAQKIVNKPGPKLVEKYDISDLVEKSPWEGPYAVFNMLVYAEPGEGKTPFVCSVSEVPEMLPALLIDADAGTLSVRNIEELDTIHIARLAMQKDVSQWAAIDLIWNWLRTAQHNYKTILLDGGTDIERACELDAIQYGIKHKKADNHDPELAELADYRRIQERMKRMYRRFRDLETVDGRRVNFIATAHEGARKQDNGKTFIQPLFMGKGSVLIQSVFDIVARMVSGPSSKDSKVLAKYLVPSLEGKARGRDRSLTLGERIEEPSMKKIAESIFSK